MAVYRFLRFISLLAVSTALRKSVKSRQKSTKGRRTDAQLTADLKAKGVLFQAKATGCKIMHSTPLNPMTFTITFDGKALDTEFEDTQKKESFNFYESANTAMWTEQDDFDGIQHLVVLKQEDWQRFRTELLPLAHLSQDTLEKIQQLLTPKRRKKPIERSQCLRLIEVITSHAPLQYRGTEEASTEWIYNFYAAHGQRIRKELTEIERISDLQSKGILIHPEIAGCRIEQIEPLPRMNFTVFVYKDHLTTLFEDSEAGTSFYFSWGEVVWGHKDDEDHHALTLTDQDRSDLTENDWLPLAHVSDEILAALVDANEQKNELSTMSQCLNVVELVIANPMTGYETDDSSTNWIFKFYNHNSEHMNNALEDMEAEEQAKAHREAQQYIPRLKRLGGRLSSSSSFSSSSSE